MTVTLNAKHLEFLLKNKKYICRLSQAPLGKGDPEAPLPVSMTEAEL